ncbi:MAG: tRNA (guanine(10)-N(2))-dimethyltransferase [Methanomicrobiales archaeon]|nr:tRNA (guanine(10)-N(2))-dimethyltransferase [Methanomicrobiales archaeon]
MDVVEIQEGTTRFFVPMQDPAHAFPAASAPVFFNQRMELNRDATVLLCSMLRPSRYLDVMGASGARGVRIAHECGLPVTINDRDPGAAALIARNAEPYGDLVEVVSEDANVLMHTRRFDAVDIDPFGTPAYFLNAAAGSARRYLFATATDTAPLCGAHLKAGMRRYFARPLNTEYHSEVALRILLGFAAREIIKYDRGCEPLFCFSREHFVRVHLQVTNGARRADATLARIGYVHQCPACPYREEQRGLIAETRRCPACGAALTATGPLWLGAVCNRDIVAGMLAGLEERTFGRPEPLKKLLQLCGEELDTAHFYDYHVLGKTWKCSPPDMETLLARLRERGYAATRTHHAGTGVKTDAPLGILREAMLG